MKVIRYFKRAHEGLAELEICTITIQSAKPKR
jgi:hypothetical protein